MNEKDNKKLLKAKELNANGQYDEARGIIKRLYNKYPNNKFLKFELGKLELILGKKEQGIKRLQSLSCAKDAPYALIELGKIEANDGNFNAARNYFCEALNTPNKSQALLELARLEIELGNFETARKIFKKIINTKHRPYVLLDLADLETMQGNIDKALYYAEQITDKKFLNQKMLLLIRLYILGEDYMKALQYMGRIQINNENEIKQLKQQQFYIKYKLGLISNDNKIPGYLCKQIFNYDENESLIHIKQHLHENDEKENHSLFNKDIDINALFEKAKMEKENYEVFYEGIVDSYVMDLGYIIGKWKDIETTKIRVVTIHNTDDIITMYPYINQYNVRKIDSKRISLS